LVEHTAENRGVAGSIPALATNIHAVSALLEHKPFPSPSPAARASMRARGWTEERVHNEAGTEFDIVFFLSG
jgi:hypothetical protein